MQESIITDMMASHKEAFDFLLRNLKTGKLPIYDHPVQIFEPQLVANREQLLHGVVRTACLTFEKERLFDFELMPNKDIVRLSTHLRTMEGADMRPPFEDWNFAFVATSDFRDEMEGAAPFASSLYVAEKPYENAVFIVELTINPETNSFLFVGGVLFELPFSSSAKATVIACANGFQDKLRSLIDSILDPSLAALVMLNTKGVDYTEQRPPRPERRRAEREGQPAPSHWHVGVAEYFTALRHTTGGGGQKVSGNHASPVPHLRRGHWRNLASGEQTWVRDCLVNVSSQDQGAFVERDRKRAAYKAGNLRINQ